MMIAKLWQSQVSENIFVISSDIGNNSEIILKKNKNFFFQVTRGPTALSATIQNQQSKSQQI